MTSLSQKSRQSVCHGSPLFALEPFRPPTCPRTPFGGQWGSVVKSWLSSGINSLNWELGERGLLGCPGHWESVWLSDGVCVCVCVRTCMLACVRVGEITPEDDPGEGKHKKKPQTNSSIFFPTSDMMASNRSMHTNSKCQKVCMCVTEMCLCLSLWRLDIWQLR